MKIFHAAILTAMALVMAIAATPASAQQARVCFYQHADFQGDRICARPGEARRSLPDFNNVISSITIRGGARVTVCEHERFAGRCRTYRNDTRYIGDRMNDRISSYRIQTQSADEGGGDGAPVGRRRVCFFEHADFRGRRICARLGEAARRMPPGWNDRISSLRLRGDVNVQVCEQDRYGGRCRTFKRDRAYVGDRWNDRVSSFRVVRAGSPDGGGSGGGGGGQARNSVCFFEHADFRGRRLCARSGEVARRMPPGWNDKISSLRIRGNAKVQVCSRNRLNGNCREFSRDRAFVGNRWNDRISSFRVARSGSGGGGNGGGLTRNSVCFFEHASFRGRRLCARVGEAGRRMPRGWNDVVSSIRVGRNAEVQICEHDRFGGRCRVHIRDREYVGDRWNDRISSFRVVGKGDSGAGPVSPRDQFPAPGSADRHPHRVCFFTKSKHRGRWFCDRPRNRVDRLPRQWRNDIESIRMFGSSTVKVCDKPNLKGNCHIYERSQKRIGGAWSNKLSSYEILLPR